MTRFSKIAFGRPSTLALAVALAVPAAVALPAVAHAQAAQQDFNIQAGDLATALQRYSAATGVQLVYSSDLVAGKRSPGVSGQMTPQQALGQLLAGSGLSARVSGNTATLVLAGAAGDVDAAEGERLLGPVRVEGSQGGAYQTPVRGEGIAQLGGIRGGQDEEAVGYRAKVSGVATGTPVAIEDIPRSITVQTQEQLEKQEISTIGGALNRMPGVTLVEDSQGDAVLSVRGFAVEQIQIDGGATRRLDLSGNGALNLDAYERVELVRGPNALFVGENSPGGSINLVRKRPGADAVQSFSIGAGSFGRVNLQLDTSTPALLGSPIAFRTVASLRRDAGNVDHYSTQNALIYAIADIPLGASARLELGGQFRRREDNGTSYGLPRYISGELIKLPRDFNVFEERPKRYSTSTEIFSKLFVDVAEDWDFEGGFTYTNENTKGRAGNLFMRLLASGQSLRTGSIDISDVGKRNPRQLSVDAKLTGRFETFGITHNVLAAFNYNELAMGPNPGIFTTEDGLFASITSIDDYVNPPYEIAPGSGPSLLYSAGFSRQFGIILGDTLSWRDLVSTTITLRRDYSSLTQGEAIAVDGQPFLVELGPSVLSANSFKPTWRPSYSLSVKPAKNLTFYASYAEGFFRQDQAYFRTGGSGNAGFARFTPSTFKNLELGGKLAGDLWLAGASYYNLKDSNVAYPDDGPPVCPPGIGSGGFNSQCYVSSGAQRKSKGFDLEFSGEATTGLQVLASLNYNKSRFTGVLGDLAGSLNNLAPKLSGSLFLDWAPSAQLSLRLGARYRGRVYQEGTRQFFDENGIPEGPAEPFEFEERPSFVLDAGVDYSFMEGVTLRLNIENLANKRYLSTVSSSTAGGNFYGKPRSFMASLTWKEGGSVLGNPRSSNSTIFGQASDWYAAVDLGWQRSSAMRAKSDGESRVNWKHGLDGGAAGFARLGYYVSPRFRTEIELQYRPSAIGDIQGESAAAPFGVCGVRGSREEGIPFNCDNVEGDLNSYGALVNAFVDLADRKSRFVPFVGGGVGMTRDVINYSGKLEGVGGSNPWQLDFGDFVQGDVLRQTQESIIVGDVSHSLSWQLMAGFSYKLDDRLKVDATWRMVNSEKIKWASWNLGVDGLLTPSLTPEIGNFSSSRRSHLISLGIRWALGADGS